MFIEERQRKIMEILEQNGRITIDEITGAFAISDESARRDLRQMEAKGLCRRTRGGAIPLAQVSIRPPADRNFAEMPVWDNYREIARHAASMIRENDIFYMTGGSFGYIMLSFLPRDIHYTIVVNSADIAQCLREFDNADVYAAGGKMRQSGSFVDSLACDFVGRMHFDLCFLTGAGLTVDFGLSNGTDETAAFQRTVLTNSRRKVLLIPSAKVGVDSFIKVCGIDTFDTVITDWDCLDEQIAAMEKAGVTVVAVEEPK